MSAKVIRRSRSLHRTSLVQPREPAFWLYLAILVVTGLFTLETTAMSKLAPPRERRIAGIGVVDRPASAHP